MLNKETPWPAGVFITHCDRFYGQRDREGSWVCKFHGGGLALCSCLSCQSSFLAQQRDSRQRRLELEVKSKDTLKLHSYNPFLAHCLPATLNMEMTLILSSFGSSKGFHRLKKVKILEKIIDNYLHLKLVLWQITSDITAYCFSALKLHCYFQFS